MRYITTAFYKQVGQPDPISVDIFSLTSDPQNRAIENYPSRLDNKVLFKPDLQKLQPLKLYQGY